MYTINVGMNCDEEKANKILSEVMISLEVNHVEYEYVTLAQDLTLKEKVKTLWAYVREITEDIFRLAKGVLTNG